MCHRISPSNLFLSCNAGQFSGFDIVFSGRAGSILNKRVSKLVVIVPSTIVAIHLSNHAVLLHNPPITTPGIGAHELDLFAGIDNHEVGGPSYKEKSHFRWLSSLGAVQSRSKRKSCRTMLTTPPPFTRRLAGSSVTEATRGVHGPA